MTKLYLEITADTNDADYISHRSKITILKLEKFKPLIKAIKKQKLYNWVTNDFCHEPGPHQMYPAFSEELIEEFMEYIPHGENGIHTIESIRLIEVGLESKLL